ncbi:MAG: hypothetical protein A2286_04030 [Gammaproteobacteria bacterium RIFOXYA12_FULL_61_12]|nr:MAG: hypothetical protein A2514_14460 [Gammaproteobacteria bacterium RIFOXYD12_FULL_61_37]OGT94467.1 MAG: hypothetical protein A2286_04030 [Gammaproteobacteria bacterium RIFOXYA12_FULL_61_12]
MKKTVPNHDQAGFSLVELIVGGTLMMSMLLAGGVFMYNGAGKAGNLLEVATELGKAAARYNADTGLHPKYPSALFFKNLNTPGYTTEGVDATNTWQGPYIKGASSASSSYPLSSHVNGAEASFVVRTTGLPSGAVEGHAVQIGPLPQQVFLSMLSACNGTDYSAATAPTSHADGQKCSGLVTSTTAGATWVSSRWGGGYWTGGTVTTQYNVQYLYQVY